ncbi:hypothetical protein NX722_03855 [Endozoicomonas gorgoniicola]|uniref:Uncharacterized protein n=1 Tax=Endozoicomonas gorgoniicola TaxID=1234144 RepID=A0ABT3MQZ0_9GAMM|nr:hypothetical protein [Endozoicomonas gorgoniicola]MCW7551786.1 hypothetical protein [Endozoicomonas gorgoniicola]
MDEPLSSEPTKSPGEEIIFLLTAAILRKQQKARHKEPVRLDKPATSCMTVDTAENNDRGSL